MVLLSLIVAHKTANGCSDSPNAMGLVGAGASLPQHVYQDTLWLYDHTKEKLTSCYYSQGSGSGVCRAKGWLPVNCTLDCVEGTGCTPCYSDCPEWEATGQLDVPEEVDFGATDMVLIDEDYEKVPGLQLIPTVAGAVVPVYNLGGILSEPLVVDRHVLPLIFSGNLTRWNDARLKALQPSHVADMLPDEPIEVVVRGDTSGSTHIWKSALIAFSAAFRLDQEATGSTRLGEPTWGNAARFQPTRQSGTSALAGHVLNQPYTLGYVVLNEAIELGLEMASFYRNESGVAVTASQHSLSVAVIEKSFQWTSIADVSWSDGSGSNENLEDHAMRERVTQRIVDTTHPSSWPISGYTYIIVNKDAQSSRMRHRTCESHRKMVEFWRWFLADPTVEELMVKSGFVPLPTTAVSTLLSWLKSEVRCDGKLSAIQDDPVVTVRGSVQHELRQKFDLMEPSYKAIANVDLEIFTHTHEEAAAARNSDSEAFVVSVHDAHEIEETDATVNLMWQTFAFAVLVNLDGHTAQSTVRMTMETLAGILGGRITRWDDPALVAENLELVGVSHNIQVLSNAQNGTQCEQLVEMALQSSLQRSISCISSAVRSANHVQVLERMSSTPYSLAVLPMLGSLGERIGKGHRKGHFGVVRLNTEPSGFVLPTQDALVRCAHVPGLTTDMSGSCYPLHLHVFVTLKKDYGPYCGDPVATETLQTDAGYFVSGEQGREAVNFWLWELKTFTEDVMSDSLALQPIRMHNVGQEWKVHQLAILEQVGCDGVSFLNADEGTTSNSMYFVLLMCSVGALVVILVATATIFRKNMQLKTKLVMLENDMCANASRRKLDLDSPILKVIRYLEGISEGKPVETDVAQQLAEMLQRADNFDRPDLLNQLPTESYGSQILQYLHENTARVSAADALKISTEGPVSSDDMNSAFVGVDDGEDSTCNITPPGTLDSPIYAKLVKHMIPKRRLSGSSIMIDNTHVGEVPGAATEAKSTNTMGLELTLPIKRQNSVSPENNTICVKNTKLSDALESIGVDFFYDILPLDDASNGRPLTFATMFLFQKMGLIEEFKIDEIKLERYVSEIERGYLRKNAYHNAIHAADVLQRTCTILTHCCSRFLSKLQILAALLAAVVHDLRHPGTTNAYHVTRCSSLAMRFNDQHVLENHSLVHALGLLRRPGFDFLENMTDLQQRKVRAIVIDMVLATDLSMHFEVLSKFQSKVGSKHFDGQFDDKAISLIMQMTLKCADIGNCCLPHQMYLYWTTCLQDEFFQQGDMEKQLKMSVSPLMDRNLPGALNRENQIGFLDVIVVPLFTAFGDAMDGMQPMRDQLNFNWNFWKKMQKSGDVLAKPLPLLREQLASHWTRKRAQGALPLNLAETMGDVDSEQDG